MNTVKIGVMDRETRYVERLCAYLSHYGNCIWNVSAFTDKSVLERYMEDRRIDLLLSTNNELIEDLQRKYPDRTYVLLTDEQGVRRNFGQKIYLIYRYQSARLIGDNVKDIVDYKGLLTKNDKVSVIIYSPVGRCGKTTMAKQFVGEASSDKWLYVGMEDYGGDSEGGDDFLYYIKERRDEEVKKIIESCGGHIQSPFSLFDVRRIDREDIEWFLKVFEEESIYRGVVFDMGSAMMESYEIMLGFDHIIIPFLDVPVSQSKIRQFEELIEAYELNEIRERMHFINMDCKTPPTEEMLKLLG